MNRLTRCLVSVTLCLLSVWGGSLQAQVLPELNQDDRDARRFARDPRLQSAFEQIPQIRETNPELALDLVQNILSASEDSYLGTNEGSSVKAATERLVSQGPEAFREAYLRRYSAQANGLLEGATGDQRLQVLRDVVRQFAITPAGQTALQELIDLAMDAGDSASVLLNIRRLTETRPAGSALEPRLALLELWALRDQGRPQALETARRRLQPVFPNGLTVNGKTTAWPDADADFMEWLNQILPPASPLESAEGQADWPTRNGHLRRNATAASAAPFADTQWKAPLADRNDDFNQYSRSWTDREIGQVNTVAQSLMSSERKTEFHPIPVTAPLVIGDLVIYSGLGSVKALSLKTGELQWSSRPVDDTFSAILNNTDPITIQTRKNLLERLISQRGFRDQVQASLSTDGTLVYHIGLGGLGGTAPSGTFGADSSRMSGPLAPRNYNQLQAFELSGGLCVWTLGGPPRQINNQVQTEPDENDLSGAFFCTTPVVVNNELICLIEQAGQLRLVAFDSRSNPSISVPLWTQALLNTDSDLSLNPERRNAGCTMAVDGGILVVATGNGTVAGFDLANRRWSWLQVYASPIRADYRRQLQFGMINAAMRSPDPIQDLLVNRSWVVQQSIIAGDSILVTPSDGDRLLCLDRETGSIRWSQPRGNNLYLAGATSNMVVVVGRSEVLGLSLKDGSRSWSLPIPDPSGIGLRVGNRYSLPLSTAEILTIELERGVPLARSPLQSRQPAGTLVAGQGTLITQTGSEIRAFRSRSDLLQEVEQKLAADSTSKDALALRGELKLHDGDIESGLKDLQSIASPDDRVQSLLAWMTIHGLYRDFDSHYRPDMDVNQLFQDPSIRAQAWQLIADGLKLRNDLPGAVLATVQQILCLQQLENLPLQSPGLGWQVHPVSKLQGQLLAMWERLSGDDRARTRDQLLKLYTSFEAEPARQAHCWEIMFPHLLPVSVELESLPRLPIPPLAREQRLAELSVSPDLVVASLARLQLLEMELAHPERLITIALFKWLQETDRDLKIDEYRTVGSELDRLLGDANVVRRRNESSIDDWGKLTFGNSASRQIAYPLNAQLKLPGTYSPWTAGWIYAQVPERQALAVSDSLGRSRFSQPSQYSLTARASQYGRAIAIEINNTLRIMDLNGGTETASIRLSPSGNQFSNEERIFLGDQNAMERNRLNRQITLRTRFVAYDKDGELVVANPMTGKTRWNRTLPGIDSITADEDTLAVMLRSGVTYVYRAVDGHSLGIAPMPPKTAGLRDYNNGLKQLLMNRTETELNLTLRNPADLPQSWTRTLSALSQVHILEGRQILIVHPENAISMLNPEDGSDLFRTELPELSIEQAPLIECDKERIYLCLSEDRLPLTGIPRPVNRSAIPVLNGKFYALNRANGQILWKHDFDKLLWNMTQPGDWPFLILGGTLAAASPSAAPDKSETNTPPPPKPADGSEPDPDSDAEDKTASDSAPASPSSKADSKTGDSGHRTLIIDRQTGGIQYSAPGSESNTLRGWTVRTNKRSILMRFGSQFIEAKVEEPPATPPATTPEKAEVKPQEKAEEKPAPDDQVENEISIEVPDPEKNRD